MRSRKALIVILFLTCTSALYGLDSLANYLISVRSNPVLPVSAAVGQTAESNSSAEHTMLSKALSQPYGLQWLETYVGPDFRKAASELGEDFFPDVLPASGFVMSVAGKNADNSRSVTVYFPASGRTAVFVIKDNLICAMGL